jgi:23S rRNA (guanosine2251-2'-O)-methyltransferase
MKSTEQKILILHNIRSSQNVGSLFRTADAAGIDKIYISGITPCPIDRFGRPNPQIIKASLGAELSVPWEAAEIVKLLDSLKKDGVQLIGIEQSSKSLDYKTVSVRLPVAFILGNEVDGIPKEIVDLADVVAEIPMQGKKESLNVAVAGGIALFRMFNI